MYPLLVIAVGASLLLLSAGVLPAAVSDLLERSWALLLIIWGLDILLANRIAVRGRKLSSSWIALGLSIVFVTGVITYAYNAQLGKVRDDYVETLDSIPLGDHIQGMNIRVQTLETELVFLHNPEPILNARFAGSTESQVEMAAIEDDSNIVNMSVREERPGMFPKLDAVGSGTLRVGLPFDVPINELDIANTEGRITLDLQANAVSRLSVYSGEGDVDLYMPRQGTTLGQVTIENGNLFMVIDSNIVLRVTGAPETVEVNPNEYRVLRDGVVESVSVVGTAADMTINLNMSGGTLTITSNPEQRPS